MPPSQTAPAAGEKLAGIELLRFLAAFTVLLAHYNHFFIYHSEHEGYTFYNQPLFQYLGFFYRYGTRAVEVFWCLSGFVFVHKYGGPIFAKAVPPLKFFWLRFSRLYPLHFATLILIAVLQYVYRAKTGTFWVVGHNNLKHFVLQLGFASHWGLEAADSFNAPVWSVSLEVLAYAVFYAVTFFLGAGWRTVIGVLAAMAIITHYTGTQPVLVRCLLYFYLGGLASLAYRWVRDLRRGRLAAALAVAVALFVWAVFSFLVTGNVDWLLNLGSPVALVLLAVASAWLPEGLSRPLDFLGNLTYASYLIHFPLQLGVILTVFLFHLNHRFALSPVFLVAYLLAVFGLARLIYVSFELPVQAFIRQRTLRR